MREQTSLGSAGTSRGAPNVAESCGLSQVVMFVNADIVGVGNVPVTQQTDSTFADSQDRELSNGSNLRVLAVGFYSYLPSTVALP
ncbi:MAG: hypothetical protein ACYTFW_18490 [Planctomycetota bacterium]